MKNKISVIVPIYKVERYLHQCLDSIVGQTYGNLEIILIDDGSPDNCGAICDEYAAKDPRITVLHKQNGGLSAARNDGIERATGDWIAFVDSDDWCELDYYEQLLAAAKDKTPDVIFAGGYHMDWPARHKVFHTFNKKCFYCEREHIEDLQADIIHCGLPWDKLYKAPFIKENDFHFTSDIRAFEDFLFNFQVLAKARCVVISQVTGYHYRQVEASIANGYNPDKPAINYAFIEKLHDCAQKYGMTPKIQNGVNAAVINAISIAMNCCFFHPANPKDRKEVEQEVNEMIQRPYCRQAIYSPSNRYLSSKKTILKYALRLKRGGVLRMLYTAREHLKP